MPQWRAFANWRLVSGLRIWPLPERNCRKSLATCRNIPNFGRRRPETGFDPHCVADAAVFANESVGRSRGRSLNPLLHRKAYQCGAKRVELRTPLRPWQRELKSRAPSRVGARPQPAAMRFDDPPTDRQSHTGALRLGGEECLEKALALVEREPGARIPYRNQQLNIL